jgi:hypothetical protein
MFDRQADEFRRLNRTSACARGTHDEWPHMLGYGGGFNPGRLRLESGIWLCACDCHASCPVASGTRLTVPAGTWRESCTCPGAEAQRISLDEAGVEFPDFGEVRAKAKRQSQSRREAFRAARAKAAGMSREEVKDLYVAELRARGQDMPSEEALDASVAALTGNYRPTARNMGRLVVDAVRLFRATRRSLPWQGVHYPGEAAAVDRWAMLERRSAWAVTRRGRAYRAQADRGNRLVVVVGASTCVDRRHSTRGHALRPGDTALLGMGRRTEVAIAAAGQLACRCCGLAAGAVAALGPQPR